MPKVFISHSTEDREFTEFLVELLRKHYIATWYSPRQIEPGSWEHQIQEGMAACDWFVVVLTPAALRSNWVRREVDMAFTHARMYDPACGRIRIIPLLAEHCDWKTLHPHIYRCQAVDFTMKREEAEARLLRTWHVERQSLPQYRVGDVIIPVHIFVGGDGSTSYRHGDILCSGPNTVFQLPPDVDAEANRTGGWIEQKRREAEANGRVLVNNRQIRLDNATWGTPTASGGLAEKPLRLTLGWTQYFHTVVTNMSIDAMLPSGRTVGESYQGPLDSFSESRLSNPIATNLSIVTSDNWIYITRRSRQVAWNVGGLQPAVSGDGQPEDVDTDGVYAPFLTAQRETIEEATGLYVPSFEEIMFFGLARTFKTRFPFLFGQVSVKLSHTQLESQKPTKAWEGRLIDMGIPFTMDAVTKRVRELYMDQRDGRIGPAVGTTLFSLLQSVLYRWPERWNEVIDRLSTNDSRHRHAEN